MAKGPRKWTLEALEASAQKYSAVRTWRTEEPSAYATAARLGVLDTLTEGMSREKVPQGFWTKSQVLKSARKFKTKVAWLRAAPTAYSKAHRYNWIGEATAHMEAIGNKYQRLIYAIKVEQCKCVYVGLTGNPKRRFRDHLKTKRFRDIIDKVGLDKIEFEHLTDFLPQSEAAELETKFINKFEAEGYELLNRAKAGGLGGIDIKWTNDAILRDARKYNTVMEWANAPGGAYAAASKKGILEKAASHLKRQMRAPGSWTLEEVIERSRIFETTVQWRQKDPHSYNAAKNHGWYNRPEVSGHMRRRVHFNKKWTKEAVLADAKGYKTIGGWTKASGGAVSAAKKMGIYKTAVAHMEQPKNVAKWSKEAVIKSAQKHQHKTKWKEAEPGAYGAATKKGWYAEATAHMETLNPLGKWDNKVAIIEEAKKYQTKSGWQDGSVGSYEAAKRLGCFEEAIQHMTVLRKKWTRYEILDVASQFKTISEWRKNNSSCYAAAHRLKMIDQATAHMTILNPVGIWTKKDAVLSDAKKYATRSAWYKNSAGAYASAKRNGWFEDAVQHMTSPMKNPQKA